MVSGYLFRCGVEYRMIIILLKIILTIVFIYLTITTFPVEIIIEDKKNGSSEQNK